MTTLILVPGALPLGRQRESTARPPGWWNELLERIGSNARRAARARRELLRRAEAYDATQSSYAADLRGAALDASA